MFSFMCVCRSVCLWGSHVAIARMMHWTSLCGDTPQPLLRPFSRHGTPTPAPALSPLQTWDTLASCPLGPLLVTSGGHHWTPVQTCSLEDPPIGADIWWPPKHVRLASRRYTSYWNAFLCCWIQEESNIFTTRGIWIQGGGLHPWGNLQKLNLNRIWCSRQSAIRFLNERLF